MPKTGIIVAQMGGPATQDAVEPFIRSIFEDPDLVPIPGGPAVSKAFGWAVAKARGPFARRNYRLIGGGSPILDITDAQAQALRDELAVGESELAELRKKIAAIPALRQEKARLQDELAEYETILPNDRELDKFFDILSDFTKESGTIIKEFKLHVSLCCLEYDMWMGW
jgi:ferrochelatase